MSEDPFEGDSPRVRSAAEGDWGTCPCGWESAHLFPGGEAAATDLLAHLRTAHPERGF